MHKLRAKSTIHQNISTDRQKLSLTQLLIDGKYQLFARY